MLAQGNFQIFSKPRAIISRLGCDLPVFRQDTCLVEFPAVFARGRRRPRQRRRRMPKGS